MQIDIDFYLSKGDCIQSPRDNQNKFNSKLKEY